VGSEKIENQSLSIAISRNRRSKRDCPKKGTKCVVWAAAGAAAAAVCGCGAEENIFIFFFFFSHYASAAPIHCVLFCKVAIVQRRRHCFFLCLLACG
jgi:hypothetical protein